MINRRRCSVSGCGRTAKNLFKVSYDCDGEEVIFTLGRPFCKEHAADDEVVAAMIEAGRDLARAKGENPGELLSLEYAHTDNVEPLISGTPR